MLNATAIGHLGQDATINEVNGKKVVNFSIAHSESWKDSAGVKQEKTTWLTCSYWDGVNVAPYLKKGQQVYLTGTPSSVAYVSKGGEARADFRIQVLRLELIGSANKPATAPAPTAAATPAASVNEGMAAAEPVDDLPF